MFIYEKQVHKVGTVPTDEQIKALLDWLKENMNEPLFQTNNLVRLYPEAAAFQTLGSGLLVSVLSAELQEYVIWFKPERNQTIKWAGNPDKSVEFNEHGIMQISPRHSFEVWSQTVKGYSEGWRTEEISAVTRLKEEIIYAINLKAGAIRLMNEKLRQAYEELNTFSYTISHDLKNPIAAIKSYSQILNRAEVFGDKERGMAAKITERADKMNFMISEILSYSRIGRQALEYRPVNAQTLINDIVKDLDLIYNNASSQVTIGQTPDLLGDPLMLLQVFSNLIGNAVKYSQESNPAIVHIEGAVNDTEVCYTIRDNGLGIPAKDLPKIFELFNRMDNVSHIEGSGVGLAIVKRIVEKHRGRIWAESEIGKGSVFYVAFNKHAPAIR